MSKLLYGLMSDIHAHNWSAFATLDAEGRNTRLMDIIREIGRCCKATLDGGSSHVVIAGDLFHVRGEVSPLVFNPIKDVIQAWIDLGIVFWVIPGNHDLETEESTRLGSAVEMLRRSGFVVMPSATEYGYGSIHDDQYRIFYVPYIKHTKDFFQALDGFVEHLAEEGRTPADIDLICHLGIDGTLNHIKDKGADAERLAKYGFKRVFSGDYHHHKDFGNNVYSIGALTHQTWSDVGTKAGFMLVYDDKVEFRASHAPSFVNLQGDESDEDLIALVDGNYVAAKIGAANAKQIKNWREDLVKIGAKGVIINAVPDTAIEKRAGVTAKSLGSIEKSVADYCTEMGHPLEVAALCGDILAEVMV